MPVAAFEIFPTIGGVPPIAAYVMSAFRLSEPPMDDLTPPTPSPPTTTPPLVGRDLLPVG